LGPQGWFFAYTNYINWNLSGSNDGSGDFTSPGYPKQEFPGIIGGDYQGESGFPTTDWNNFSMLVETWLYFPTAGTWQMGVNSDDGFSVMSGQAPGDIFGQLFNEFEGGAAGERVFSFDVLQPGLYPFRLLYEQGGGGASCEWFTVTPAGQRVLINDASQGTNAVYAYLTAMNSPIYVAGVIPMNGCSGVNVDSGITALLVDGNPTQVASVQMWINGAPAIITTSRSNNLTTATVVNTGSASLLLSGTDNTVTIVYRDNASTPHSYTNSWQFATLNGSGISTNCAVSSPEGLISWWTGNSTANDLLGMHNGFLENGATYAPGEVNSSFSFNGADQYVAVPNSSSWGFGTNAFSIDLWANYSAVGGSSAFLSNDEGGGNTHKWIFWLNGSTLQFHVNMPTGATYIGSASFTPNVGRWYHIALTRSGTNFLFYINANLVSSNSSTVVIPTPNAPLTIGQAEGGLSFNGLLDEIQIYNRALSASEIQAIYQAGTNGMCAPTPLMFTGSPSYNKTNGFILNASLRSSQSYHIQANTNLASTNWITLTNFIAGTAPIFHFTNKPATNISKQFYRIVSP
jgi:hypothetical protein